MFAIIARLFGFAQTNNAASDDSVAHSLMERAEARAGHGHQGVSELREAAAAYLRVVR